MVNGPAPCIFVPLTVTSCLGVLRKFVKRQKNDAADGEAIYEAVSRLSTRLLFIEERRAASRSGIASET